ncbi:hypothetical protein F4604DRAFT_1718423 [Suillus subluteus]|nr:hypothetical protein F4604DRAFT_1718423 [Suillus subluteus]
MSEDYKRVARHRTRTQSPPRYYYYYIDFGISRKYEASNTNPSEVPIFGGDKEVPEFKRSRKRTINPGIPFQLMFGILDMLFKKHFLIATQV